MTTSGRIFAGLIGLFAAAMLVQTLRTEDWLPITIADSAFEITVALFALWYAALAPIPQEFAMFKRVLRLAVYAGAFTFVAGLAATLILFPASDAPLFTLFITAPIGFTAGALAAFLWTRLHHAKAARAPQG